EDLTDYLLENGVRARYLHSEVDTLRRIELLRELRAGEYDVLVGINLLREGLDLPEVSLVAILDADKEGFLRSGTSLIQTIARAVAAQAGGRTAEGEPTKEASAARAELVGLISELTEQMHAAAAELQFEVAARLRDEIRELKSELRGMHAAGV